VALALLGLTGGRTATSFLTSCARALKGLAGSLRFGRFQAQHILLPLLCVAAAFAPTPEDWIRQGTAALGTERPADALACFDQAVERTTDPGLVAFDSGVALARLGRYREAELHFRRCLGDADGPRRPRALYDLGTCLLQRSQGKQGEPVREAIGCFEQALGLLAAADPLRPDVAHNLDLAKLLLPHALAADRSAPESSPDDHPDAPGPSPREASPSVGDRDSAGAPDSPDGPIAKGAPERGKEPRRTDRSPPPGKGNLPPLPDQDALAPLSPEDTRAYLDQAAERIRQARREQLRRVAPAPSQKFPDW
jgi:tetratricopeptide (TPR) repeat protein